MSRVASVSVEEVESEPDSENDEEQTEVDDAEECA